MRTLIVGGGEGCRQIIKLVKEEILEEIRLDIVGVVDPDPAARGIEYARRCGIKTFDEFRTALQVLDIELILELTGLDRVVDEIYKLIPTGIRVIDHTFARIFWDMGRIQRSQKKQLNAITKLEKKLAAERRFLQNLADKLPDMVLVLDADLKIATANSGFGNFFGLGPAEVIGRSFNEVFETTEFRANADKSRKVIDSILKKAETIPIIWQAPPPLIIFWEVTHTPMLDEAGRLEYILITWHPITERIFLHRELESTTHMFKSFIDSAQDWIAIKDLNGRYITVNKILADSYGLKPEDFIGKKPDEFLPEQAVKVIQTHDDLVRREDVPRRFEEVVPIDGVNRFYQTIRFPLKNPGGRTIGTCSIKRDVSREKELGDQLVQAEKMAEIGKLSAGVAHEINNPLTGILAFTEDILEDLPPDDPKVDDLRVILRETLRCRNIVRNLLDFARQEEPRLESLNPNQVIDLTLRLVEKLPQFKDITIIKNLAGNVPPIQGDLHQLQQVILNLLSNSAEAMKKSGNIKLTTSLDGPGRKCVITVEDSGPGVPPSERDKIFKPFYSTKGTNGLGLAVSWGIIERHRGTIEVGDAPGGGAVFRMILPVS